MKEANKLKLTSDLEDVRVWEMATFYDERGKLFKAYPEKGRIDFKFNTVEHFFTLSRRYVLRGMHLQGNPHNVSKVISIVQGRAIDFLIDLRPESTTYFHLQIINLDEQIPKSIYIPSGVAHGYIALESETILSYRMDGVFCKSCDTGFGSDIIKEYLPIEFSLSIRSERDKNLVNLWDYKYKSECIQYG